MTMSGRLAMLKGACERKRTREVLEGSPPALLMCCRPCTMCCAACAVGSRVIANAAVLQVLLGPCA